MLPNTRVHLLALALRLGFSLLTPLFVIALAISAVFTSDPHPVQAISLSHEAFVSMPAPAAGATSQPTSALGDDIVIGSSTTVTSYVYFPLVSRTDTCGPIPGVSYGTLSTIDPMSGISAENHPDLNLALRGYELVDAYKGLIDLGGQTDPNAPQLPGLFADNLTGTARLSDIFSNVYAVHKWDWSCNCRGPVYTKTQVTLAGLAAIPGETIHVPPSGYDIGGGYGVLVLYASADRITLKYTREDNVVSGYTIHLEHVCVEPSLLALYRAMDAAGRVQLPALLPGQALGRAAGSEIGVAIRDAGAWLDPRSRKDWWKGR